MDGYELPVFRALTEKMLIFGIPRNLAILNATLGIAFVLVLSNIYMIFINLFIHVACVQATKKDPEFFDCLQRHVAKEDYYDI